jgi:hypothetical protein
VVGVKENQLQGAAMEVGVRNDEWLELEHHSFSGSCVIDEHQSWE